LIVVLLVVALAVNSAWSEPTVDPAGGNPYLPLHTGSIGQSKSGGLVLGTGSPTDALILENGNLCLSSDCRDTWPTNSDLEIIAVHSQTASTPSCPAGWDSVWTGYSFGGAYQDKGLGSGQDLSGPGSCLEQFIPMTIVECSDYDTCDYFTANDYVTWLSATSVNTAPIDGVSNIEPYISRCNVCKSTARVITRHSFSTSVPSCPSGSTELWNGYSLKSMNLTDGMSSSQDLGSPGSCLQQLYPTPFIECQESAFNRCDYLTASDISTWLSTTATDDTGWLTGEDIEPYISRCAVCAY